MTSFQKAQYIVLGMLVPLFGIMCVYAGAVYAQGPLNPPGAPAPTMKSLDQIYDRVGDAVSASMGLAAVDGIGWSRGVVGSPGVLGTVPAGYELVILRIVAQSGTGNSQQLRADGEIIFAGQSTRDNGHYAVDVPNGSMVVGPEMELTYIGAGSGQVAWVCGYLRSVQ